MSAGQLLKRYGTQGMRRDTGGGKLSATRVKLGVAGERIDETALFGCRCGSAEARMGVEYRQQSQVDPRRVAAAAMRVAISAISS